MELRLATLADYAIVSADGKLSVMGIFDEISPPELPFRHAVMYVVASFEGGLEEAGKDILVTVALANPSGVQMTEVSQDLHVEARSSSSNKIGVNLIFGFAGHLFSESGRYEFSVKMDGQQQANLPLLVREPSK